MEHVPNPHDDGVAPTGEHPTLSIRSNGGSLSSSSSSPFVFFPNARRRNVPPKPSRRRSPRQREEQLPSFSSVSIDQRRGRGHPNNNKDDDDDDLSVTNLRRAYSSLLQELAPRHFDNARRRKNRGTVSVNGSDDEGYEYDCAYAPDGGARTWWRWTAGGRGSGEGGEGVEEEEATADSNDGIRRYYTGGVIAVGNHDGDDDDGGGGGGANESRTILSLGSLDVDVGSMDGVRIDGNAETEEAKVETERANVASAPDDHVDMALSSSSLEEIELNSPANHHASESLPPFTATLAWRLRAAHAPTTPRERRWDAVGSDLAVLARRDSRKAEEPLRLWEAATSTEERVCEGLRKLGRLVCRCERRMGREMARRAGRTHRDDENDEMEAAEAVFAYFCEKNVLPLLVDSFSCRPPPWTSDRSIERDDDSSPFSGVAWTVAAKAQILQTLAMLIGNAVSPLSLTYLLSNNYVNELIMGVLPLSQWKDHALEELLPPFVTLLRGLVMTLRGDGGANCAPLLLCRRQRTANECDHEHENENERKRSETYMPLFHAAVHVLVSPLGSSLRDVDGSLVRTTAMNAVLNLCRVTDPDVRSILIGAVHDDDDEDEDEDEEDASTSSSRQRARSILTVEQRLLFSNVCRNLQSCHGRSVRLIMASLSLNEKHGRRKRHPTPRGTSATRRPSPSESSPATEEARARHADVAESLLAELRHWWGFVDDLLSCSVRVLNVRLCETIVRQVIVDTVLRSWHHRSPRRATPPSDDSENRRERYRSIAETRASLWFLAQLFGTVEYPPLFRMAATAVLHARHPESWCDDPSRGGGGGAPSKWREEEEEEEFFVVTPALNALVAGEKSGDARSSRNRGSRRRGGQEADAGAGGGSTTRAIDADGNADEAPPASMRNADDDDDGGCPAPSPARTNENSTTDADRKSDEFASNPIRSGLRTMLAGKASMEDSVLASMLVATILENDAVDGHVLETLDVFSTFETSLAAYLQRDLAEVHGADVHPPSLNALARGMETCSMVGMMLAERLLHHRFSSCDIEELRDSTRDPFDRYFQTSEWIAALDASLSYFAAYSRTLSQSKNVGDLFAEFTEMEIRRRYAQDAEETHLHPDHHDDIAWVCHLHNFFPSNLIDDAQSLIIDGEDNHPAAGSSNEIEAAKFAIRITLHLRCLKKCIEEFRERCSSIVDPRSNRWYDQDDCVSFRSTQKADDAILVIGGIQTTRLPRVGTDIDLRGRTFFRGSLPTKASPRMTSFRKGTNSNMVSDLAIVIDPSEVYVTRPKRGDPNRFTVLAAIPLRTVVASATEGSLLHVAIRRQENVAETQNENNIVKNGKMTLRFESNATSLVVKECLDNHCSAYRSRIASEIDNMLQKLMSEGSQPKSPDPENEEEWADFQGA